MNYSIIKLIYSPIGAFVCWLFLGCKNHFMDQLTEENSDRNTFVGMFSFAIILIVVMKFIVPFIKSL
jgi:hypothetical protein